jgi:AbiV family abortive infection protein
MKLARFEVRLDYLLTSHQEGWQIKQAGFLARAAFLHQISMEECAKIDMLGAWATSRLTGRDVDDSVIARVFRDHKAKNHANAYNAIPTPEKAVARESGDWSAASKAFKKYEIFRRRPRSAPSSTLSARATAKPMPVGLPAPVTSAIVRCSESPMCDDELPQLLRPHVRK